MKRILIVLIIAAMILPAFNGIAFEDYKEHWASSHIEYLLSKNIIKGDENGNVNPDKNITRAEFATVINAAFGFSVPGENCFSDVFSYDWYYTPMKIALKEGYFKGDNNGNGNPLKLITREEASTALARILKLDTSDITTGFSDDDSIQSWAKGAVKALKSEKIINGYDDNTFRPQANMKRGECFTIISKKLAQDGKADSLYGVTSFVDSDGSSYTGGGGGGGGSNIITPLTPSQPYNLTCNMSNYMLSWKQQNNVVFKGTITRVTDGKTGSLQFETSSNNYNILSDIQALMQSDRVQNEMFRVSLTAVNSYGISNAAVVDINYENEIIKVPEISVEQNVDLSGNETIKFVWQADANADTYKVLISNDNGETYSSPLTVTNNGDNKEIVLTNEQISSISGKEKIKISVTSKYPDLYLDADEVEKDITLPLFGVDSNTLKYNISNKRHFLNMKSVKDGNFHLTNDIDLGNYTPFEFAGKLNGNGYSINLTLAASLPRVGLFSKCTGDSQIKNLSLKGSIKNSSTDTSSYTGGIFAEATAAFSLENVKNYASIEGYNYVGGVVGYAYQGKITLKSTTIENFINYGDIKGNSNIGGVGGLTSLTVKHCANLGKISGDSKVAGIVAWCYSDIDYCYNAGDIEARTGAGGIMGVAAGNVDGCECLYNSGNITGGKGICFSETAARKYINCYNANPELSAENSLSVAEAEYDNCYTISQSGTPVTGVEKITPDELKDLEGIKFDKTIWKVDSATLYDYPQFIEFPHLFIAKVLDAPSFEKAPYNDRNYVNFYLNGCTDSLGINILIKNSGGETVASDNNISLSDNKVTYSVPVSTFINGETYTVEFYNKGNGIKLLNSDTVTKEYIHSDYKLPSPAFLGIEWSYDNSIEGYTVSWSAPTEVAGINDYEITVKDSNGSIVAGPETISGLSYNVTDINSTLFNGKTAILEVKSIDLSDADIASLPLEVELNFEFAGKDSNGYYLIGNVRHLNNVTSSSNYKVISDFIIPSDWAGVSAFSGVFDGNGKTITLSTTKTGLFTNIAKNGTVKNVVIGGSVSDTTVTTGIGAVAGINKGTVTNCVNNATVNAKTLAGGIAGINDGGTISYCTNNAKISGSGNKVAGIVGEMKNNSNVSYCANEGEVTSTGGYIGGVAGYQNKSNITNSYNTASVTGKNYVGGIAGGTAQAVKITDCYNAGNITATGTANVAGINGYSGSGLDEITNCYNIGTIKFNSSDYTTNYGIFGVNKVTTKNVTLKNCYYLSATPATVADNVTFTECKNLTDDKMKDSANFVGFDFEGEDAVWKMGTGDYLYPVLIR